MAYVDLRSGPRGMWLLPFVHMDADKIEEDLGNLLASLRPSRRKPIYLCLRSYQTWLQAALHNLGAQVGPRQAVMVRWTARRVKVKVGKHVISGEAHRAEPTMPIKIPTPFVSIDNELNVYDQTPNY